MLIPRLQITEQYLKGGRYRFQRYQTIMKNNIKLCILSIFALGAIVWGFFPTVSYAAPGGDKPRYFEEFTLPLEDAFDPNYNRAVFVRSVEVAIYNSPFGIIPAQPYLIARHEAAILQTFGF